MTLTTEVHRFAIYVCNNSIIYCWFPFSSLLVVWMVWPFHCSLDQLTSQILIYFDCLFSVKIVQVSLWTVIKCNIRFDNIVCWHFVVITVVTPNIILSATLGKYIITNLMLIINIYYYLQESMSKADLQRTVEEQRKQISAYEKRLKGNLFTNIIHKEQFTKNTLYVIE